MSNVPSTTDELNYPIEREVAAREAGYVKFEFDPRIFRPRPFKDREKADNKLFFLAFDYNKFKWFRNWPNLRWYYLKLPLHRVNEVTDSGRIRQAQIMCEPSMNRFATEQLAPGLVWSTSRLSAVRRTTRAAPGHAQERAPLDV